MARCENVAPLGPGSLVRLDADVAVDGEASRELAGRWPGVPWVVVAGVIATAALAAAGAAWLPRRLWVRVRRG